MELVLVSTCPIIVEDQNHKAVAEFDGAFIRINKGLMEIRLIEAKNTHRGSSGNATSALTDKLQRIGAHK